MSIIEFYKYILEMIDLRVDESGQIFIDLQDEYIPLQIEGLPVFLPTEENIKTSVSLIDGKPNITKYLFHPLYEDSVVGPDKSFSKFKDAVELFFINRLQSLFLTLVHIIENKLELKEPKLLELPFILNSYKARGIREIIDKKTKDVLAKVYEKIMSEDLNKRYLKIYIKKGGKIGNIKYNKTGVLTFPFLESMEKFSPKNDLFLGLKLRSRDVQAYIVLFEYVFDKKEKLLDGIQIGSLNKISPSLHVLLLIYNYFYQHLSPIIEELKGMEDLTDDVKKHIDIKPLPIDANNLSEFIDQKASEINNIPSYANVIDRTISHRDNETNKKTITQTKTNSSSDDAWSRFEESLKKSNEENSSWYSRGSYRDNFYNNRYEDYSGYSYQNRSGYHNPYSNSYQRYTNTSYNRYGYNYYNNYNDNPWKR